MSDKPCIVTKAGREVIENKLLTALEGDAVAILASREDLDMMIMALGCVQTHLYVTELRIKAKNLCDSLCQLHTAAFQPSKRP